MDRRHYKIDIDTPDPGYAGFPVSIMNRSTYEAVTFDPALGKPATISYRLNKAGCIRVRIIYRRKPHMLTRTLMDWTPQDFGDHWLKWDGCDASGNVVDNKNILVVFEAQDQDNGLRHRDHDESICKDPLLKIETQPESKSSVNGSIKIFTSLKESVARSMAYEARYYIDYNLFHTDQCNDVRNQFEFILQTTNLSNGKHLISVNIDDLNDHIGNAGIVIKVGN